MKVTEIKFNRKVNLGNYDSADLEMTAVLSEGDNTQDCVNDLINQVEVGLGLSVESPKKEVKEEKPKKEAKKEKKEVKEEKPKKEKKEKKAKKEAVVTYDRELPHHKTEFSNLLKKNYPNWKNDAELKPRAIELSKEILIGKPFLSAEGDILDSFKKIIKDHMEGSEGGDDL